MKFVHYETIYTVEKMFLESYYFTDEKANSCAHGWMQRLIINKKDNFRKYPNGFGWFLGVRIFKSEVLA